MRYGFINNFSQLLAADLAIGATTMALDGGGALLSAASADLVYTLTLVEKDSDGNEIGREIVHVTGAATNTLTVVRAQEGTAAAVWPTGSAVEMRLTAGAMSALVQNKATNAESFALGDNASATAADTVVISNGTASVASTGYSNVIIGGWIDMTFTSYNTIRIGDNTYNWIHNPGAVAIGANINIWNYGGDGSTAAPVIIGNSAYMDDGCGSGPVAIGSGSSATSAPSGVAIGDSSSVEMARGVAIGPSARVNGALGVAVGETARCFADRASAFGTSARASSVESVAIGPESYSDIVGGIQVNALPYLPSTFTRHADATSANSATQSASSVVVSTSPLDLTIASNVVTLDIPAGARLFIDAIDVVITGSATPGGSPEIRIGPDNVTPATYLAATAVTATAVGERQTHTPLVGDGVTTLRVETVTAGTGTLAAKIVFRGYVMEL